jgi:hypothetical protein
MTLAARLVLAMAVAVGLSAAVALVVADHVLAHRFHEPLEDLVEARLAWIRSAIEPASGEIDWRDAEADIHLAPVWSLATAGGSVLRQVGTVPATAFARQRHLVIGDPAGPVAADAELSRRDDELRLAGSCRRIDDDVSPALADGQLAITGRHALRSRNAASVPLASRRRSAVSAA